jgi:hypothetical protein
VRMLKQVRTGLVNQRVCVFVFGHDFWWHRLSVCEVFKRGYWLNVPLGYALNQYFVALAHFVLG